MGMQKQIWFWLFLFNSLLIYYLKSNFVIKSYYYMPDNNFKIIQFFLTEIQRKCKVLAR